jgi:hypothetical protein
MIRPEHQFYIRPDLRKAASTKAESAIRPKQLVRKVSTINKNWKEGRQWLQYDEFTNAMTCKICIDH